MCGLAMRRHAAITPVLVFVRPLRPAVDRLCRGRDRTIEQCGRPDLASLRRLPPSSDTRHQPDACAISWRGAHRWLRRDRKSGVEGKSGAERVERGGSGIIKKKK